MTRTRLALFIALASITAIALAGYWTSPERLRDGTVPLRTALQDAALFLSLFLAVPHERGQSAPAIAGLELRQKLAEVLLDHPD
jgi:hypothetical protein